MNNNSSALALRSNSFQDSNNAGESYLKFKFGQQISAVFAMDQAQEVLVLPVHRLTPVPNMPPHVIGLLNRRSHILWVVDLAQMLELAPVELNLQQYNIIIIRSSDIAVGLVVQSVENVTRLSNKEIQPPLNQVSLNIVPYLQGCVFLEQEVLLVLSAEELLNSPLLHNK